MSPAETLPTLLSTFDTLGLKTTAGFKADTMTLMGRAGTNLDRRPAVMPVIWRGLMDSDSQRVQCVAIDTLGAAFGEPAATRPLAGDRFARGFVRHMERADATDIEVAYMLPLVVLARLIAAGRIPDVVTLFRLLAGIQRRVGWHLGAAAGRRQNPRLPGRSGGGRLFAPHDIDPDRQAGGEPDPSFALLRAELFKDLMAAVRGMGKLPARTFREVQAVAHRAGTRYGAFRAVAQRADLDAAGRMVGIRPDDANGGARDEPSTRTVRQVRKLYAVAVRYLNNMGRWRGPNGL